MQNNKKLFALFGSKIPIVESAFKNMKSRHKYKTNPAETDITNLGKKHFYENFEK